MTSLFDETPSVLIQDPTRGSNFILSAEQLREHAVNASTWDAFPENTVTFRIPVAGDLFEDIPPYVRDADSRPSVLIQDPAREIAFFIDSKDLDRYLVDSAPVTPESYGISFIMPVGMELIEELPEVMKGPLQAGEGGFRKLQWAVELAAEQEKSAR
jgi:hypothetical protein